MPARPADAMLFDVTRAAWRRQKLNEGAHHEIRNRNDRALCAADGRDRFGGQGLDQNRQHNDAAGNLHPLSERKLRRRDLLALGVGDRPEWPYGLTHGQHLADRSPSIRLFPHDDRALRRQRDPVRLVSALVIAIERCLDEASIFEGEGVVFHVLP
jgi:hypothetical protein